MRCLDEFMMVTDGMQQRHAISHPEALRHVFPGRRAIPSKHSSANRAYRVFGVWRLEDRWAWSRVLVCHLSNPGVRNLGFRCVKLIHRGFGVKPRRRKWRNSVGGV